MKKPQLWIGVLLVMGFSAPAFAWDGVVQGTIQQIDFVGGASGTPNFDVRVVLAGSPVICTGGAALWGYINAGDPNYSTLVAVLMMAKTTGSKVKLLTVKEANGYCHIGYMSVS